MPTRDRWRLAERAASAALAQEGVETEVVLVDDASRTPCPLEVPGLRVVRRERSTGVGAARNAGTAVARSDWVAFLDDDDLWAPDKLRRQLDAAAAAGADWAYTGAVAVDEQLRPLEALRAPDPASLRSALAGANVIPAGSSNVVVRAALLRDCGGFDEQLSHLADWDLWLRLAAAGSAAAVEDPLVAYVWHRENMVAGGDRGLLGEFARLRRRHAQLSPRHFLDWTVGRHVLAGDRRGAARLALEGGVRFRYPRGLLRAVGYVALPERVLRARAERDRAAVGHVVPPAPPWLRARSDG